MTARVASVRTSCEYSACPFALLERAHLIGAHHLAGEWWLAAPLLLETRRGLAQNESWSGFLAEVPMSRTHAWRLMRLAELGLAHSGASLSARLRQASVKHRAQAT